MELAVWLTGTVTLLFFLPVTLYAVTAKRRSWGLVRDGRTTQAPGTYRGMPRAVWVEGSAPVIVRVAAFSSFFLGQMIIPGALAAILGFIALVGTIAQGKLSMTLCIVTLSAPTGLIVAGRLLAAGIAMLGRNPAAVARAHTGAAWEIRHNVILLSALCLSAILGDTGERIGCAMIGAITVLAIGHGVLLQRAAAALVAFEDAEREQAHESEQVAPSFA
jgi:hypothetical protein